MDLYSRIVQKSDTDEIYLYEENILIQKGLEEDERMIEIWNSRWRKEALEHYFNLGWSFLIRDKNQTSQYSDEGLLVGYFMAQPLVFFDGQTQSLWIEHFQYSHLEAKNSLLDLAIRLAKEKHFQRILFPDYLGQEGSVSHFKKEEWLPKSILIKTTRSS